MKNTFKLFGLITWLVIAALLLAGCSNQARYSDGSTNGGTQLPDSGSDDNSNDANHDNDPGNGDTLPPGNSTDPDNGNDESPGDTQPPVNIERHNWMSRLPDNTFLGNITIPGTHNSGSADVRLSTWMPDLTGLGQTQEHQINMQLNHGIRFFDIRLSLENNRLWVVHGSINAFHGNSRLTFEQVLEWFRQFLADNPSETVFMSVRNDRGHDLAATFRSYTNDNRFRDLFLRTGTISTLGDARGNIVLFRRFPGFNDFGIDWLAGWRHDQTFEITRGEARFSIDDRFEQRDTNIKAYYVTRNMRNSASSTAENSFHVTFASISGIALITSPRDFAWNTNPAMNNVLGEFLQTNSRGRFGAVMMNFYDNNGQNPDLVMNLIRSNFYP